MKRNIVLLMIIILISSCIGANKPVPATFFYLPDYLTPVETSDYDKVPMVIKVSRFSIAPEFSSTNLVYSEKENVLHRYNYHKWITTPADFTGSLLTRYFTDTGMFTAVLPYDSIHKPDYIVEGRVNSILERNTDDSWSADFSLSITLIHNTADFLGQKIIFQKTYNRVENCKEKTASCLSDGMSIIMSNISAEITSDIYLGIPK